MIHAYLLSQSEGFQIWTALLMLTRLIGAALINFDLILAYLAHTVHKEQWYENMILAPQPPRRTLVAVCDAKPSLYDYDHGNLFPQASEGKPSFREPISYRKNGIAQGQARQQSHKRDLFAKLNATSSNMHNVAETSLMLPAQFFQC